MINLKHIVRQVITTDEILCDVCGKSGAKYKCRCCKKDLCKKCSEIYSFPGLNLRFGIDAYLIYCRDCFEIGKLHRKKIDEAYNKFIHVLDREQELWYNKMEE